jgi:hypothetical protein
MKNRADQVTLDEFRKWVGDDEKAMKDQEKRIAFGKEYCTLKEWKFSWKIFDREVNTWIFFDHCSWCSRQKGIRAEKLKGQMILETFSVYFTFATPLNPIPEIEIGHPQGALALAAAAASNL